MIYPKVRRNLGSALRLIYLNLNIFQKFIHESICIHNIFSLLNVGSFFGYNSV